MILVVVREQGKSNFGYAEDRNDVPPGFLVWAELDTRDWTLTFSDGRSIRYRSFEELDWDLGEAMADSRAGPRGGPAPGPGRDRRRTRHRPGRAVGGDGRTSPGESPGTGERIKTGTHTARRRGRHEGKDIPHDPGAGGPG